MLIHSSGDAGVRLRDISTYISRCRNVEHRSKVKRNPHYLGVHEFRRGYDGKQEQH